MMGNHTVGDYVCHIKHIKKTAYDQGLNPSSRDKSEKIMRHN